MAQCITWKMAKLNPGSHQSAQASLQKKVRTKRQISAVPLRQSLLHCTATTHTGRIVVSVWSVQYRLVKTAFVLLHFICSVSSSLLQLVCPQLSPSCPPVGLGPDWLQGCQMILCRTQCLHCGSCGRCKGRCGGRPCKPPSAFIRTRSSEGKLELIQR